jgi:hypothetical protein
MSDATNPGDIVVTGQRRGPGGAFPEIVKGNPTGDHQDEVSDDPNYGVNPNEFNPCGDPATRHEWDIDAAAAAAAKAIKAAAAAAGENGLSHRERGAFLLRKPDGSIVVGPIVDGSAYDPGQQPVTILDPYSIPNMSEIVGIVHSHQAGNHLPSPPSANGPGDAGGLTTLMNIMNTYNPGSGANARMYIVAETTGSPPQTQINVYAPSNIAAATGSSPTAGPEVNPDGQACPI